MKYLVIDMRSGGDWSLDLIFAGLVKVLGPENVFDFPRKSKHREWLPEDVGSDWGKERRTLGYTPLNDLVSSDLLDIRREAISENLTVIMDERDESFTTYCRLGLHYIGVPVVIVAGHDRFWNESPQMVHERFGSRLRHMFIDNWRDEYADLPRTSLINWSTNFDHYWIRPEGPIEKTTDICFFGYNSHPDRERYVDHILSSPEWRDLRLDIVFERRPNTTEVFLTKQEYFNRMLHSKVCINLRGAADKGKTLRFYEIPYVGSFMLTQKFDDRQLHPFLGGVHCGEFDDEYSLDANLRLFLGHDEEREFVAEMGHRHLMEHHTCEARVRYILETIDGQR